MTYKLLHNNDIGLKICWTLHFELPFFFRRKMNRTKKYFFLIGSSLSSVSIDIIQAAYRIAMNKAPQFNCGLQSNLSNSVYMHIYY